VRCASALRLRAQAGDAAPSPVLWAQLALQSQAPRGAMLQPPAHGWSSRSSCHAKPASCCMLS